jgi:hypothetical protein
MEALMDSPLAPYRDAEPVLRARHAELVLARRQEIQELPNDLIQIWARRVGRVAGGAVAVAGAATLVTVGLLRWGVGPSSPFAAGPSLTVILLALTPLAVAAALVGRAIGRASARASVSSALAAPAPDLLTAIARLEANRACEILAERAARLERASAALPLAGAALLAPLTLHWLVYALFIRDGEYDSWIGISGLIVGHCHLLVVFFALRFAKNPERGARAGVRTALFAALASIIPGGFLLFIPPVLVVVTGLAFLPATFGWVGALIRDERALLDPFSRR